MFTAEAESLVRLLNVTFEGLGIFLSILVVNRRSRRSIIDGNRSAQAMWQSGGRFPLGIHALAGNTHFGSRVLCKVEVWRRNSQYLLFYRVSEELAESIRDEIIWSPSASFNWQLDRYFALAL